MGIADRLLRVKRHDTVADTDASGPDPSDQGALDASTGSVDIPRSSTPPPAAPDVDGGPVAAEAPAAPDAENPRESAAGDDPSTPAAEGPSSAPEADDERVNSTGPAAFDSSPAPESATADSEAAADPVVTAREPVAPHATWTASHLPEIANPQAIKNVVPTLVHRKPGARVPAMTVDTARIGSAFVAAASTRGALHQEFRSTRQDAYLLACSADEQWLVFAVADGVTQAPHSHVAADHACRTATEAICAHLNDSGTPETIIWEDVVEKCRAAIRKQSASQINPEAAAKASQADIDRAIAKQVMSTTLQVGVVQTQLGDGGRAYVTARLAGDGSAHILRAADGWRGLDIGKETGDGVQTNDVTPLPRDPGEVSVRSGTLLPGDLLLSCTDGIGEELGDGDNETGDFLRQAWAEPVSATEFLRTINFVKSGASDDRTAVVVWS